MAPVHLLPARDARPGASLLMPGYDAVKCAGCRLVHLCRMRAEDATFLVQRVRGVPMHCRQLGADVVACEAVHVNALDDRPHSPQRPDRPTWVCDAEVFLGAFAGHRPACVAFVDGIGRWYDVAITRSVEAELDEHGWRLRFPHRVIETRAPDPSILEAARHHPTHVSSADLTLVQALVDDPDLAGILRAHADAHALDAPPLVQALTGRARPAYAVGAFVRAHPQWFGGLRVPLDAN